MSLDNRIKRIEPIAQAVLYGRIAEMQAAFVPAYKKSLDAMRAEILFVCPQAAELCAQLDQLQKPIEEMTNFELLLVSIFVDDTSLLNGKMLNSTQR